MQALTSFVIAHNGCLKLRRGITDIKSPNDRSSSHKLKLLNETITLRFNSVVFIQHPFAQTENIDGLTTNSQAVNFIVMGDWGRNGEDQRA